MADIQNEYDRQSGNGGQEGGNSGKSSCVNCCVEYVKLSFKAACEMFSCIAKCNEMC